MALCHHRALLVGGALKMACKNLERGALLPESPLPHRFAPAGIPIIGNKTGKHGESA